MTFVQFPDQHIICVHIVYMLFILLVLSANVVVIIADSCGRNCEIQILSEKYKQFCKSHYRNILICDTINIGKVGKTIQGLFTCMLTLTLAGNNLGWNSQCRCSVVAKGARYTGVYIGGGGWWFENHKKLVPVLLRSSICVLSYSYKCLLQNRKVIPDHPNPPPAIFWMCAPAGTYKQPRILNIVW